MVQSYSCTCTATTWKKFYQGSYFHKDDNLLIEFHALLMYMLTSLSIDETLRKEKKITEKTNYSFEGSQIGKLN